jgi:uncharacterized protein YijF (DUF1287 family)
MIKIIKNTYPEVKNVAHGKPGDICEWQLIRGSYHLVRTSDNKSLFSTPLVNKDGVLSSGKRPVLVGIVGQVKSKGWVLELRELGEVGDEK